MSSLRVPYSSDFVLAIQNLFLVDTQTGGKIMDFFLEHRHYGQFKPIVFHPATKKNSFSYMKDSSPAGKELIGFLASCKGRLNLFNTPPGTPEAETARDEFNDPSSTFGSRSDYSKPDPNSERCLISLRAGIEIPKRAVYVYNLYGDYWNAGPAALSDESSDDDDDDECAAADQTILPITTSKSGSSSCRGASADKDEINKSLHLPVVINQPHADDKAGPSSCKRARLTKSDESDDKSANDGY